MEFGDRDLGAGVGAEGWAGLGSPADAGVHYLIGFFGVGGEGDFGDGGEGEGGGEEGLWEVDLVEVGLVVEVEPGHLVGFWELMVMD